MDQQKDRMARGRSRYERRTILGSRTAKRSPVNLAIFTKASRQPAFGSMCVKAAKADDPVLVATAELFRMT